MRLLFQTASRRQGLPLTLFRPACFTCAATSLACRWGRSYSVKFKCLRPPFTSLWTSQDTGAT